MQLAVHNRGGRQQIAFLAAILVSLVACGDGTEPTQIGGVEAVARLGQIEITNRTTSPVFTFVIGRESAALVDWIACVNAAVCPPLAPNDIKRVPYPKKTDGRPEREALVYWWHAVLGSNGQQRPDSIRVGIVPL